MRTDEIKEGYIYADESGSHFRSARKIVERKNGPYVRYWDSKGRHGSMSLGRFAAWASHPVVTSPMRPYPKKPKPPPYIWPGD